MYSLTLRLLKSNLFPTVPHCGYAFKTGQTKYRFNEVMHLDNPFQTLGLCLQFSEFKGSKASGSSSHLQRSTNPKENIRPAKETSNQIFS